MLVAEIAPLSFGSSQVEAGNSNSIADAIPAPTPTSTGDPTPSQTTTLTSNNFSIMQITDTQFLSSTYPNWYNNLTAWIIKKAATPNLTSNSSSFTFGNTAIGTYHDQNEANAQSISYFTSTTTGSITDLLAYIAGATSGNAMAALYAVSGGSAGALLAQSNSVNIGTIYSWVDFQLPSSYTVIAGTTYGLAIMGNIPVNLALVTGTGQRTGGPGDGSYTNGFTNPFGTIWFNDLTGAMSIYASGNLDFSDLSLTISPTSANIVLGGYQQFTSTVTGGVSPYSYQWYLNDTAVPSGTSQTWTFTPTTTGNYKVYLNVIDASSNLAQSNIVTSITVYDQSHFNFSIMQITDSQTLNSAYLPDNPNLYSQLCNWIVNNTGTYNLKMVVHTGDIINENWDTSQWQNANSSMSILSNSGVPYVWCAGNHDQTTDDGWSGNPNSSWVGDQYFAFNPLSFSNKSYWAGDCFEGKNTAAKFSVGNYNFLLIDIESFANDSTLNWMRGLLNTYSNLNYNIVVATHIYLASPNGDFVNSIGDGTWETNLQNLLDEYPKVFMTLNGHCGGDPAVNVHNQVNGRTQIEYDRQETDNRQGACSVRIYSFDLNSQTVDVSTYSVWDDLWITDSGDSFSFSLNLTSIPTVSITPTLVRLDLGQSQMFSSSVSGGKAPYSYQWYLNDAAVLGATSQNWIFTPTTTGQYKVYVNVIDGLNTKAQSNTVTDIIVYPQLTTSISPVSVNMRIGTTQQFTSTTTGGLTPYTYQWYYANGTAITGATTSTLTYKANSTGTYNIYLNVTDNLNYKTRSNTATINVNSQPIVTISPTHVTLNYGQSQTFNASVTGGITPYTYQWYLNDTAVSGATASTWNFTPATTGHYKVYLNVTDTLSSKVQSNIVTDITVYSQLAVSITPISMNMTVGTPQTFSSIVSGGAQPYTYQWYLNGSQISNANSSSWTFTPTSPGNFTIYLTVKDNNTASAQSNKATIKVEGSLSLTVSTDKPRYIKWSYITINVNVANALNGAPVQGASVNLTIYDTHGRVIWTKSGITDTTGRAQFTYLLAFDAQFGNYRIDASVKANGYKQKSGQKTFFSMG